MRKVAKQYLATVLRIEMFKQICQISLENIGQIICKLHDS